MRYSVSDFIDSDTLRSHLQEKTLEPAIECILIAQSEAQPLSKKLNALQERYDTYTEAQFAEGIYHTSDNGSFKEQLGCYITRMREELTRTEKADDEAGEYLYVCDDGDYPGGVFDSFEKALNCCKALGYCRAIITREKVNAPDTNRIAYVINTPDIIRILMPKDSLLFDLPEAYAEIPHEFQVGDIVEWFNGNCSVIMNADHLTEKPEWLAHADSSDMKMDCLGLSTTFYHECGGAFHHEQIPILWAERVSNKLSNDFQPLLALSLVVLNKLSLSDFLEAYSNGMLNDLMKYHREI